MFTYLVTAPSPPPSPSPPFSSPQPSAPVTSLVHFSTSITMAQVVVVGTQKGTVSWYISQPPQKTFSLLFSDRPHYPHDIVSLQVCLSTHATFMYIQLCMLTKELGMCLCMQNVKMRCLVALLCACACKISGFLILAQPAELPR